MQYTLLQYTMCTHDDDVSALASECTRPAGGYWEKQKGCCGLTINLIYISPDGMEFDEGGNCMTMGTDSATVQHH